MGRIWREWGGQEVFRIQVGGLAFRVSPGPKATREGLGSGSIGAGRVARGKGILDFPISRFPDFPIS